MRPSPPNSTTSEDRQANGPLEGQNTAANWVMTKRRNTISKSPITNTSNPTQRTRLNVQTLNTEKSESHVQ